MRFGFDDFSIYFGIIFNVYILDVVTAGPRLRYIINSRNEHNFCATIIIICLI